MLKSLTKRNEWIFFLPNSGIDRQTKIRSPLPSQHETHYAIYDYRGFSLTGSNYSMSFQYDSSADEFVFDHVEDVRFTGNVIIDGTLTADEVIGGSIATKILKIDRASGYVKGEIISVNDFKTDTTKLIVDRRSYIRKTTENVTNYDFEEINNDQIKFNVRIDANNTYPIYLEYQPL